MLRRCRAPGPDVVVDHLRQRRAPGVDEQQAVLGGEGRDVGEGGAEADPVGDLDEAAHVVDGMEGRRRDLAVPQALGDRQDVRSAWTPLGGSERRVRDRAVPGRAQAPWDFSSAEGAGVGAGVSAAAEVPLVCDGALRLALRHALLELVLGRAEVPGQLGDRRPAEEEHDENDGHDEQVGTENVSKHEVLLHPGPRGGELGPRLDPFPPRGTRTARRRVPGVRSHPASRMPMTSAATLATPPTDPHRASCPFVVARWCRKTATPASSDHDDLGHEHRLPGRVLGGVVDGRHVPDAGDDQERGRRARPCGRRPAPGSWGRRPPAAGRPDEPRHHDLPAHPHRRRQDVQGQADGVEGRGRAPGYLPCQFGGRFSAKATGPSMASAEVNTTPTASALIAQPSASGTSAARFITLFE